ncbi:peptidoglycan-binding protein [Streptomyces glomeratus]|uniref:Peptidoglycan-binding protein n=1 Tax=Streptomyces glomeratus TaxID=284452 RepID=A0ABP6M089_9ACTN|nr:peptidoglycan-binding protein [Streptomyces glomeratus]MCF1511433.1 peptidoglycan-binding protein [Streptomyces glomeratus]
MKTPVCEDIEPAGDCDCPRCARGRGALPRSRPCGRTLRPAVGGVLALAAVGAVLVGPGEAVPAVAATRGTPWPIVPTGEEPPSTPQGHTSPLHGTGVMPSGGSMPTTTRAEIINRAKKWVAAKVPYSMDDYWTDGYRQDCSGFVSMAWNLGSNEWTGSLDQFAVRISKDELQPGDILLFHNVDNPEKGSHVVIFGGWTSYTHRSYTAYEQTPPHARRKTTPYPYSTNPTRYVPYRYKGVVAGKAAEEGKDTPLPAGGAHMPTVGIPGLASVGKGADGTYAAELGGLLAVRGRSLLPRAFAGAFPSGVPAYPGRDAFRPGVTGSHITRLGRQLAEKGFGGHYTEGPGPRWSEADRRGVEAFQRAQGWRGSEADGYPGPETWRRLFS